MAMYLIVTLLIYRLICCFLSKSYVYGTNGQSYGTH